MPDILIFAIDPGTVDTGIALARNGELVETDTIHVPKSWKTLDRTLGMMNRIEEYIQSHVGLMDSRSPVEIHMPYEAPVTFHGENGTGRPIASLLNLVVLLEYWARRREIRTFPYSVNDIKEGIAGRSNAPKAEVELIMRNEWSLHEMKVSNHEWDAISVFTYHLRQLAIQAAIVS